MTLKMTPLVLAAAMAFAAAPSIAADSVQQSGAQPVKLKDGSTLYLFKDGKMARADRYGRAVSLKNGERLETADGKTITASSNDVSRLDSKLRQGHNN